MGVPPTSGSAGGAARGPPTPRRHLLIDHAWSNRPRGAGASGVHKGIRETCQRCLRFWQRRRVCKKIWSDRSQTWRLVSLSATHVHMRILTWPLPGSASQIARIGRLHGTRPGGVTPDTQVAQLSSDLLGRCSCGTGSASAASGRSTAVRGTGLRVDDRVPGVTPCTGWSGMPGR